MKNALFGLLLLFGMSFNASAFEMVEVLNAQQEKQQQIDDKKQLDALLAKAKQGDADAQFTLGYLYRTGNRPDNQQFQVVRDIGFLPYQSHSFTQNLVQAKYWLEQAAKQYNAKAKNELGLMYETGQGVAQDKKQAFLLYQDAAAFNNPAAQNNLARLYFLGSGVKKDPKTSYAWAKIAEINGSEDAKKGLAVLERTLSAADKVEAEKIKQMIFDTKIK